MYFLETTALLAYTILFILQSLSLLTHYKPRQWQIMTAFAAALFFHAAVLISIARGESADMIEFWYVFNTVVWFSGFSLWLWLHIRPLHHFVMVLAPLSAVSLLLLNTLPEQAFSHSYHNMMEFLHVFFAVASFVVLLLGCAQACFVFFQEWMLRRRQEARMLSILPPLEVMERCLFDLVWLGFALLTVVIVSSVAVFIGAFTTELLYKTFMAVLGWLMLAGLLAGRYYYGWRGRIAIRWTFAVMVLLLSLLMVSFAVRF